MFTPLIWATIGFGYVDAPSVTIILPRFALAVRPPSVPIIQLLLLTFLQSIVRSSPIPFLPHPPPFLSLSFLTPCSTFLPLLLPILYSRHALDWFMQVALPTLLFPSGQNAPIPRLCLVARTTSKSSSLPHPLASLLFELISELLLLALSTTSTAICPALLIYSRLLQYHPCSSVRFLRSFLHYALDCFYDSQ